MRKRNAVKAILDEYQRATTELQTVIASIGDRELIMIADPTTTNPECKSIQTVLTHVVSSGYSYAVYIQNHRNINSQRPQTQFRESVAEYSRDLDKMLEFTRQVFFDIYDDELEEHDTSKMIAAKWGQFYDIEQMMEHAIVHVLRHRRQIEHFKKLISR